MARSPWQSMMVSVYSVVVSDVPVRYTWKKLPWMWMELMGSNSVMFTK